MEKQNTTIHLKSKNPTTTKSGLTNVKVREFKYTWTIKNLEHWYPPEDQDEYLSSPRFTTDPENKLYWFLDLYPGCLTDDNYMSIRLFYDSEDQSLLKRSVPIELSLMNSDNKQLAVRKAVYLLDKKGGQGIQKFVRRDIVFNQSNKPLNDGVLTVICKMFFTDEVDYQEDVIIQRGIQTLEPQGRLQEFDEYERLLFDEKFSDFKLVADGQEFPVHRNILAVKSRVFSAMLENDTKEKKDGQVEIIDIEPEILREMLRFIYVGKVNGIEKLAPGLLAAAEKYDLQGLKRACEEVFISKLSLDNIDEVLLILDKYNTDNLKTATMEFAAKNAKALNKSEKFKTVTKLLSATLLVNILNVFMVD